MTLLQSTVLPLCAALLLAGCETPPKAAASAPPAVGTTTAVATPAPVEAPPLAVASAAAAPAAAPALEVNIAPGLASVELEHAGKPFTLMRNQDAANTVNPNFAKTSRKCPPFCVQPYTLAPGVKTIGELEMIAYLKQVGSNPDLLVIDSRTPDWLARGTLPGAVNIPWDRLNIGRSDPITVQDILVNQFGVVERDGFYDFTDAKTLVLFCNGPWCGQSPTNIKGLLKIGYPPHKLIWYRGGMQLWENLGLATVKP